MTSGAKGDSVLTAAAEFSGDISNRQTLITEVGTVADIEQLIDRRRARALDSLDTAPLAGDARSTLIAMAPACTERMT